MTHEPQKKFILFNFETELQFEIYLAIATRSSNGNWDLFFPEKNSTQTILVPGSKTKQEHV